MSSRVVLLPGAFVAMLAVLLVLPACNGMGGMGAPIGNPLPSLAGDWTVSRIAGTDVASMLPQGMRLPSISIGADGSVTGFGGVNTFNSGLAVDGLAQGDFSLGPVAATRKAGPPEAMQVESMLMQALEDTTGFRLDRNVLSLTRAEETVLEARRAGG